MKIAIVRHGQTDLNKQGIVQGRSDHHLNDVGISQAHELGNILKEKKLTFDVIYASQMKRAIETAEILKPYLNYSDEIIQSDQFIERNFGKLEAMPVDIAMPLVHQKTYTGDSSYETDDMLISRITQALFELEKKHKDQTILLVAHSHVIKSIYLYIDPNKYTFKDRVDNGDIRFFTITKDHIDTL